MKFILLVLSFFLCNSVIASVYNFYELKVSIKQAIVEVSEKYKNNPNDKLIVQELAKKFSKIKKSWPKFDYAIIPSKEDDNLVIVAAAIYEDNISFVGWKFDTVFTKAGTYFFVYSMKDKIIPNELHPYDFYLWKRVTNQ